MSNQLTTGTQVLFTRQRHEAKRAGLHWDYRIVVGDKAYSWATKKPLPDPGKSIILFEQPVHDASYALSERVEIPDGSYGAGVTTLDWVRKANIGEHNPKKNYFTLHAGNEKYLVKKLDSDKFGEKAWLFKNLTGIEKKSEAMKTNKYLEKIAEKKKHSNEAKVGAGLAGALGASMVGDLGTLTVGQKILKHKDPKDFLDDATYDKIKKHVTHHANATFNAAEAFHDTSMAHQYGAAGPAFVHPEAHKVGQRIGKLFGHKIEGMKKGFISLPEHHSLSDSKMIGLHEMGHAMDFRHHATGKVHGLAASRVIGRGPIAGGVAVGMLANDKTRDYAWAAPLVGHAPELFSEGKANIEAHKLLKTHGASAKSLSQYRKFSGKQLSGYIAKPALGAAALYAAAKMIGHKKTDKK